MLALENIRILELAPLAPGAYCTMMLGDFGAEVIKVESLGPKFGGSYEGKAAAYYPLDRNKKSIALNLKSDAGREAFYRLARKASWDMLENDSPPFHGRGNHELSAPGIGRASAVLADGCAFGGELEHRRAFGQVRDDCADRRGLMPKSHATDDDSGNLLSLEELQGFAGIGHIAHQAIGGERFFWHHQI